MLSRYNVFCKVIENKSFTKAAENLGYSQSAVSQMVKALEQELGTRLVTRDKTGITLTKDGQSYYPYIQEIYNSENLLEKRQKEMNGLKNSTIRIGTFTSISRNLLPQLMQQFKNEYPDVHFVLQQGEYTSISRWIKDDSVDFGFTSGKTDDNLIAKPLYEDEMVLVLPADHPLTGQTCISLKQLTEFPFILLDEGEFSVSLEAFSKQGLIPDIEYKVYDDYSILAMVRQGLGISILYHLVVTGFEDGLVIRRLEETPKRTVALTWKNWDTMSLAARKFAEFIIKKAPEILYNLLGV